MSFAGLVGSAAAEAPPKYLGIRFAEDARALPDPGNTVVAHLNNAPGAEAIIRFGEVLRTGAIGDCFAHLPVPSYHMTVFNGLLHTDRTLPFWPRTLATDVGAAEADRWMLSQLSRHRDVPAPFRMAVHGITAYEAGGIGLTLEPADEDESARIRGLRDRLAELCALAHRPGHDSYRFHLTLAYFIRWPSIEAAMQADREIAAATENLLRACPELVIGPPEVCTFADMTHFEPHFVLGEGEAG